MTKAERADCFPLRFDGLATFAMTVVGWPRLRPQGRSARGIKRRSNRFFSSARAVCRASREREGGGDEGVGGGGGRVCVGRGQLVAVRVLDWAECRVGAGGGLTGTGSHLCGQSGEGAEGSRGQGRRRELEQDTADFEPLDPLRTSPRGTHSSWSSTRQLAMEQQGVAVTSQGEPLARARGQGADVAFVSSRPSVGLRRAKTLPGSLVDHAVHRYSLARGSQECSPHSQASTLDPPSCTPAPPRLLVWHERRRANLSHQRRRSHVIAHSTRPRRPSALALGTLAPSLAFSPACLSASLV